MNIFITIVAMLLCMIPNFNMAMQQNFTKLGLHKSIDAPIALLSLSNIEHHVTQQQISTSKQICALCDILASSASREDQDAAKTELEQCAREESDCYPALALLVFGNETQKERSLDRIYTDRAKAIRPSVEYNTAVLELFARTCAIKSVMSAQNNSKIPQHK